MTLCLQTFKELSNFSARLKNPKNFDMKNETLRNMRRAWEDGVHFKHLLMKKKKLKQLKLVMQDV